MKEKFLIYCGLVSFYIFSMMFWTLDLFGAWWILYKITGWDVNKND